MRVHFVNRTRIVRRALTFGTYTVRFVNGTLRGAHVLTKCTPLAPPSTQAVQSTARASSRARGGGAAPPLGCRGGAVTALAAGDRAPDHEHDHRADDGADDPA